MENKNQREKTNKRCEMIKIKNYSDKRKGITLIALVITTSALESEANTWYGLYKKAKTYVEGNEENEEPTITDSGVVSSLIWGSQWDAMLNWLQGSGIDVTSNTAGGATYNSSQVTGKDDDQDKINNIYDLLGGSMEWILEAYADSVRVLRGGSSFNIFPPSKRNYSYPSTKRYSDYSSRLTLYIK